MNQSDSTDLAQRLLVAVGRVWDAAIRTAAPELLEQIAASPAHVVVIDFSPARVGLCYDPRPSDPDQKLVPFCVLSNLPALLELAAEFVTVGLEQMPLGQEAVAAVAKGTGSFRVSAHLDDLQPGLHCVFVPTDSQRESGHLFSLELKPTAH